MKSLLTFALALALSSTTLAQDAQRPAQPPRASGAGRSIAGFTSSSPDWFEKTINVDIKNATLADAVKKILEAANVKNTKIDDQLEPDKKSKISLKLDGVNVRDALAAVSRLYAAQAFVLSEDGKTTIELKNRVAEAVVGAFSSSSTVPGFANILIAGNAERYKDLPDRKIDIEAKDKTLQEISSLIMFKAGIKPGLAMEIDKDLDAKEKRITLTMKGVSLGNALDNLAGWLGCGWQALKEDKKYGDFIRIHFSKKYPSPSPFGTTGRVINIPPYPATAPNLSELPIMGNLFTRSATLPNTRVSLDKKSTDVRECLKEILKQADLSYALADDLPSDPKSFTFSNVPLATALDMICESIEVGWTTEGSADGKPIIKVGKRYKGRNSSRSGFSTYTSMPTLSRYNSLADTYRAARPAVAPRFSLPTPRIPLECL